MPTPCSGWATGSEPMNRLRRYRHLPAMRRRLLLALGLALLKAAWQVRVWPFARLSASLGPVSSPAAAVAGGDPPEDPPDDSSDGPSEAEQSLTAADLRWANAVWLGTLPWRPTCLMQAVAARALLVRRGIACQLVLGVRGSAGGGGASPIELGAHAWLRCAGMTVTGEHEASHFQPIAVYRYRPAARCR
jgi:hypothetical protein